MHVEEAAVGHGHRWRVESFARARDRVVIACFHSIKVMGHISVANKRIKRVIGEQTLFESVQRGTSGRRQEAERAATQENMDRDLCYGHTV